MMKSVMRILEKIFYVLFGIFNIAVLSFAVDRNAYIQGTESQIGMEKLIVVLLVTLIIVLSMSLHENAHWKRDMFFIFLGSMLIRCMVILFIGMETNQISDFGTAYFTALGEKCIDSITGSMKEVIFSNWGAYPLYLRAVMKVFGQSTLICVVGNAVLASVSGCLIYNLCRITEKTRRVSVLAAVIFGCWPSYLVYTIVLTPEHVNIVLTLTSINLLVWACKKLQSERWQYIILATSGACLAAAFFFKSVSLIVLVALAILLILELPKLWQNYREANGEKKDILRLAMKIGCFVLAYFIAVWAGYLILDWKYGQPVNRDVASYYLAIGLSVEGEGRYSSDLVLQYQEEIGTESDFEAADKLMRDSISENLEMLKGEWKEFFTGKFETAWRNDEYTSFVQRTINTEGAALIDVEQWYPHFMGIIHYFYLIVCGCSLVTTIINICKKKNDRLIFFSQLFIFGLMCLLLISEAQARYKCVIYPYWAIVVAYGIENVVDIGKGYVLKLREMVGGRSVTKR